MNNAIKETQMTRNQLFILSLHTYQWWEAVFIQAERFFSILKDNTGGTPWENKTHNLFVAERMFLITALHHTMEYLEKLSFELQKDGDDSLENVIKNISMVVPVQQIKDLRNMNEHDIEYLLEKGHKQSKYHTSIKTTEGNLLTTAAWTVVLGDEKTIMLGNVPINKLVSVMKVQTPVVKEKTKEVFDHVMGLPH